MSVHRRFLILAGFYALYSVAWFVAPRLLSLPPFPEPRWLACAAAGPPLSLALRSGGLAYYLVFTAGLLFFVTRALGLGWSNRSSTASFWAVLVWLIAGWLIDVIYST